MQLGDPSVLEISSGEGMMAALTPPPPPPEAAAAATATATSTINNGDDNNNNSTIVVGMDIIATNSGDDIEKRSGGGNRWPRQETFALLKIRSDMDAVFRDSSLKGPLWEEVSRKLAELGYHRSAKKCKEKFENVYKYHKRTKESRSGKPEGKTYKFFDQLQAFENQFTISHTPKPLPSQLPPQPTQQKIIQPQLQPQLPFQTRPNNDLTTTISYVVTAATTTTNTTTITVPSPINPVPNVATNINNPRNLPNMNLFSATTTTTTSTSSSTASDEDMEERYRKKRKLKEYFRRLTRQVLAKQEEMQKRFLEAIDKRERERVAQQEAWRVQEMGRINREHDILVQERSTAAAKDAAVIAFLQKLSGGPQQNPLPPPAPAPAPPANPPTPAPRPPQQILQQPPAAAQVMLPNNNNNTFEIQKANMNNGHGHQSGGSSSSSLSSRWPKAEVHALIRLRTSLDPKYQENVPKGPLWEDISAGMQRLGYNRSSKRCKEKWENINKYFKKVKESNKHRREDSKTCPYFHELDALYKEKTKANNTSTTIFGDMNKPTSHEMLMEPLMVQPEQQWRPPPLEEGGGNGRENANNMVQQRHDEEYDDDDEEEEDIDDDMEEDGKSMEEDDQEGHYEMAASAATTNNKLPSVDTVE